MSTGVIDLLLTAREFARQEVRPLAGHFDAGNGIDRELVKKMGRAGLLGAPLPVEYGGGGKDSLIWGMITEEIGRACCSVRAVLTVHSSLVGQTIARLGNPGQRQRWLPSICSGDIIAGFALSEPECGSDAAAVRTSYVRDGDGYLLNGVKKWITLGGLADVFIVIARCGENISAFLADSAQPGFRSEPIKGMIGNRGTHIAVLHLDNVRVSADRLLCAEGLGFSHVVNTAMDYGRLSIAWAGLALAEEALACMVAYSRARRQFGIPLFRMSAVKAFIAEAAVSVHAARCLCIRAAEMKTRDPAESMNMAVIAKYFSSRCAVEITNNALQLHGANGCWEGYSVERLLREAKILEVIEGTSEVLKDVICDFALTEYSCTI